MINLTNDSPFSAFSNPSLNFLLKKILEILQQFVFVHLLYEVIFFNVPLYFEVDFNLLSENNHSL